MSAQLATVGFVVATWLGFALLTSLSISLVWQLAWKLGGRRLQSAPPEKRAKWALRAALAPSLLPSLLVLVCLSPGLVGILGAPGDHSGDHCLEHAGHPHLCLVHAMGALEAPGVVLLALALGGLTFGLSRATRRLRETRRLLAALRPNAAPDPDGAVVIVDSALPFSFAAGLVRPEVFLASSLVDALDPEQLAVVVAHERAHQARRDPLRHAVAEALSLPLPPAVRRAILAELALASEQVCDEAAGRRLGDRLAVAETLVAVERLAWPAAGSALPEGLPAGLPAFGGSNVPARVRGLLDAPPRGRSSRWADWAAASIVLAGLWRIAEPLHHLTEHWLRLIF